MSRWGGRRVMVLRRTWQTRINAGAVDCGRCGLPVLEGQPWDLGHVVDRALGGTDADGLHPEHARCSRSAGGRLAHQIAGHATARRRAGPVPVVERRTW
jgi:hypothetical protein